jgi:hypothetical protein
LVLEDLEYLLLLTNTLLHNRVIEFFVLLGRWLSGWLILFFLLVVLIVPEVQTLQFLNFIIAKRTHPIFLQLGAVQTCVLEALSVELEAASLANHNFRGIVEWYVRYVSCLFDL